jgi:hypothetical protein
MRSRKRAEESGQEPKQRHSASRIMARHSRSFLCYLSLQGARGLLGFLLVKMELRGLRRAVGQLVRLRPALARMTWTIVLATTAIKDAQNTISNTTASDAKTRYKAHRTARILTRGSNYNEATGTKHADRMQYDVAENYD